MKRKILILFMIISVLLGLVGCGFVMEEESIEIESILPEVMDDGQIKITINYKNDVEPTIFYIPKGISGEVGVGIEDVRVKDTKDGITTLEIVLSNGEIKEVGVPNGISIVDTKELTEDGVRYIVFQFSDETEKRFELLNGDSGKDGLSVVEISQEEIVDETNEYFGYIKVTFAFSDGTEENTYKKEVFIRPGEAGNGIASIVENPDAEEGFYGITIYYTDPSKKPTQLKFPIPQVVEWSSGDGRPNDGNGKDGDFYFDTKNGKFYKKIHDEWTVVCSVPTPETATDLMITLDVNADDAIPLDESEKYISVSPNSNIHSSGSTKSLPIPYRAGYEFGGWYATNLKPNINNGNFTEFTIVTTSIKLYAYWIKVE